MLVQLGNRPPQDDDDIVGLLTACHGRIRKMLVLAHRLAEAAAAPPGEVAATAAQIRRYFAESFPLHLADEDEQIAPRLAGVADDVDRALVTMAAEHLEHEPAVAQLIGLCAAIAGDPRQLVALAEDLGRVAADLGARLESHLELEERAIFPYVRRLPAADQQAMRSALRDRRDHAHGDPPGT